MEGRDPVMEAYRRLGLFADPFDTSAIETADNLGVKLAIRAASLRLLRALDAFAEDPERRPVVIEKADLPAYYHVAALSQSMRSLATGAPVGGIVSLYVPIDMMRVGRVRAALHTVAEWVSQVDLELTLAAWSRMVLTEPDMRIDEWSTVAEKPDELAAVIDQLATEPGPTAIRLFGEPIETRSGEDDMETLYRVAGARLDRLDVDPAEGEGAPALAEEATDDPMSSAFTTPLGEIDESRLPEARPYEAAVADYVIAYTREHLSPVVARGIQAYVAQGTASMTEELKISKAPTKTLAALTRLIATRMRATVLIFDRFEMWETVPTDLRLKIVSTLTSLRWALKDAGAGLAFLMPPDAAPEVSEAFGTAGRVTWDYTELPSIEQTDARFDRQAVESWLQSASADGSLPSWAPALLDTVSPDDSLVHAVDGLSLSIREATASGHDPEPSRVLEILNERKESASA